MNYRKIRDEVLDFIYTEFQKYIERRENTIYYIQRMKKNEWDKEAERDRRDPYMSGSEVMSWYNGKIKEMDQWVRECRHDIEESKRKFISVFVFLRDKEFTQADCGYVYEAYFHEGKVKKTVAPRPDQFFVKFIGEEWHYEWEPLPEEVISYSPNKAPTPYWSELFSK